MSLAIATRYAQALADAALGPQAVVDPRQIVSELRQVRALVGENADLRNVLLSPAVPTARKRAVVDRIVAAASLSRMVRNVLLVMVDRRRTDLLSEIADAFESVIDERLGFVRAQVSSAVPLSDERKSELEQALGQVAGKKVRCEFEVDPNLIGGVVARIGSTVYDGSVRMQLNTLRERLAG